MTAKNEHDESLPLPNLAGVVSADLIDKKGGDKFSADYINWARTLNVLHEHAPGWMPVAKTADDGGILHRSPVGGYLMIGFRHTDGRETPFAVQAVMGNNNASVAYDRIDSFLLSKTHRRGICMAACMFFGLAYELWAKMPLESQFADDPEPAPAQRQQPATIDDKQAVEIEGLLDQFAEHRRKKFLAHFGIGEIRDLPARQFGVATKALNDKIAEGDTQ